VEYKNMRLGKTQGTGQKQHSLPLTPYMHMADMYIKSKQAMGPSQVQKKDMKSTAQLPTHPCAEPSAAAAPPYVLELPPFLLLWNAWNAW
jgi:hypothetical protein